MDFYVSPEEPVWGCYLQTGKPCFLPQGIPPTNNTTLKRWLYWACVHSLSTSIFFPYFFLFLFFAPYWLNRSKTIFQQGAFVSKQLYLLGYGLFSLALSILYYHLSLSLAQNHMAHDSRSCGSIRNQNSLSWTECGSNEELFSYFSENSKEIMVLRENTCRGLMLKILQVDSPVNIIKICSRSSVTHTPVI